jgi:hypothetical protein
MRKGWMLWGDWLSSGKSPDGRSIARVQAGLAYTLEKSRGKEFETFEVSKTSEVCAIRYNRLL